MSPEIPSEIKKVTRILDRGNEKQLTQAEVTQALQDLRKVLEEDGEALAKTGLMDKVATEFSDFSADGKVDIKALPRDNKDHEAVAGLTTMDRMNLDISDSKPVNWDRQGLSDIKETLNLALVGAGNKFSYEISTAVPDQAGDTDGSEGSRAKLIHEIILKLNGQKIATIFAPKFPNTQKPPYILKIVPINGQEEKYTDKKGEHAADNIHNALIKSFKKLLPQ